MLIHVYEFSGQGHVEITNC